MADLTDILAGAFGGAANPHDPFGYARVQLGRVAAQQDQQRIDLAKQLQPFSIATLQEQWSGLKLENKQREFNIAQAEKWSAKIEPYLDGLFAAKDAASTPAQAQVISDNARAVAAKFSQGFGADVPAALQGLSPPTGMTTLPGFTGLSPQVSIDDYMNKKKRDAAVASLFHVKSQAETNPIWGSFLDNLLSGKLDPALFPVRSALAGDPAGIQAALDAADLPFKQYPCAGQDPWAGVNGAPGAFSAQWK